MENESVNDAPMNQSPAQPDVTTPAPIAAEPASLRRLAIAAAALALCFSVPLYQLAKFALQSDLYSHVLLIPVLSIYLIWTKRSTIVARSAPDHLMAGIFVAIGALVLALSSISTSPAIDDYLAGRILSFVFFLIGISAWILGRQNLHMLAFPLGFLVFMAPFPIGFRNGLELFLQHGSAQAALLLFRLAGTSVFYHDLLFQLRGINLEVAPECSGIHSSLALFITSVVAGHFFLQSRWKCVILTLAIIPLALIRNGVRIFTLGELCVHVSPDMIDSYIHHHGGPIFFVLSLIPFFFLLRFLHKSAPAR